MPRFDNEGFNPKRRIDNDSRDRSVPLDENYYGAAYAVNKGYEPSDAEVRDNQSPYQQNNYYDDEAEMRERAEYQRMRAQQREQKKQNNRNIKKTKRKKNKNRTALVIFLIIVLVLVGMVEGVLAKVNYDKAKDNPYVSVSELKSDPMVKNILLLGVDARENQEKETSRPDTMMLLSIDMKHHCIKTTSFLRDTWVYIPSIDKYQRLNASTQKDGYSGVSQTIEKNFGVKIDGYIVTNFEMFKVLVDSIGGVEVKVTKKEAKEVNSHKKRYGGAKLEAGTHNLTGEQALAYCRIRKIDTDFYRTKRQRTVINAILTKAKKNPLRLYPMANSSAKYIETDLTRTQLKTVTAYLGICISGKMFEKRVPFDGTWEYANKGGASVIAIDADANREKLIDYIYNKTAYDLKTEAEENE